MRNLIEYDVFELDRPIGKRAKKGNRSRYGMQAEEIIQLRKMMYALLEESRVRSGERVLSS